MTAITKKKIKTASLTRPPVVAVLGHIDHGKTSLLDKIRRTSLADRESGGITQHIGAYQVDHQNQKITFIDTLGHAAFAKMRSRGAKVADLVILVVAADEGFKPQTQECLEHIQAARIPYLVALNKVDLPNLDLEKVKDDLVKNGIRLEKKTKGEVVCLPVSAKTGEGIEGLLEMVLLLAEMAVLKADPEGEFKGVVIESKLDKSRGPLATLLVQEGSLRPGDEIKAEGAAARIKAMFDESGRRVKKAVPGQPVEVLGFNEIPPIGGKVVSGAKETQVFSPAKPANLAAAAKKETEVSDSTGGEENRLKVILKTDVSGTLEAIKNSLPEDVKIISAGVGDLTESDVLLAAAVEGEIIGFRVKASGSVKKLAQSEKVDYQLFSTIYDLLETVEEKALKVMEPTIGEAILGQAEIIEEFVIKKQRVVGARVSEGKISKKDKLHLKRNGEIIGDCGIKSMKKGNEDASQALKGEEFGAILKPSLDFALGDMLVSYRS